MNLKDYVASIPDFPQEGILFRDITPLLDDPKAFKHAVTKLATFAQEVGAQLILGPESRGFMFGCPVAIEIGVGFAPEKPSVRNMILNMAQMSCRSIKMRSSLDKKLLSSMIY